MLVRKLLKWSLFTTLMVSAAVPLAACGPSSDVKHAELHAGAMPAGGEWQGVYYNKSNGHLHLVVEGDNVQGAWRSGGGDAWGQLDGKLEGNILRYSWTLHKIGGVGKQADTSGKGYFRYTIPKEGESHVLVGEYGIGDSDSGTSWGEAVKQTNMQPNLNSVKPDEIEGKVNAGGWDDDGKGGKKDDGDAPPEK